MKLNILVLILIIFYTIYTIYTLNENFVTEHFNNKNTIDSIVNNKIEEFKTLDKTTKNYFNTINYKKFDRSMINKNSKILVSVASYRDPQCPVTVSDMIKKASKPENLVIVVCQQNDEKEDNNCLTKEYIESSKATIKYLKLPHTEAKGPCWARFLIQQEYSGEEYFLQIDSHTRFVKNWDIKCIDSLKKAQQKFSNNLICLSNYVSTFNLETGAIDINPLRGPLFIDTIDKDDGFFRVNSDYIKKLKESPESKGWAAGFSFSPSEIIVDAPYDPYTPFLFFGEEMDIFARLYTKGWIMSVPLVPICFTLYDRSYRKTFWEHPDQEHIVKFSKMRLYIRFGLVSKSLIKIMPKEILQDLDYFALGDNKTFDEFVEYALIKPN